ncbi:MAG: hypothetical protein Q7U88_00315 [Desulfocapsaceae bacterium]|nr:hypothetical protein [Desulfocapsaceae bacterium]
MAMKYSKEFKDSIIAKLLLPSNASVPDVAISLESAAFCNIHGSANTATVTIGLK